MARSRKGGLLARQKSALALLEAQYEKFRKAGEDKAPWTTTRNGKLHQHKGRSYDSECARFQGEIKHLKEKIAKRGA